MFDGFSGRILSRLVVSVVQILPSRPGGSRWANPVGQSTLDETNGFHCRVRHWHFCECPLGKKHLGNCNASASRSPMRTEPRPIRYDASASWGSTRYDASASGGAQSAAKPLSQSARAISALGSKRAIRCGAEPRNAKAASAPSIKAPKPFQHQGQGAWPVSAPRTQSAQAQTLNPNHRGKTRSSSAFSHRHSEGWQPRFRWGHIQQLPLHQAPEAYRQTPTQAPSRE